jgi:hypothetical protein
MRRRHIFQDSGSTSLRKMTVLFLLEFLVRKRRRRKLDVVETTSQVMGETRAVVG